MKCSAYQSPTFWRSSSGTSGPIELVDRDPELARRLDHHLGGGEQAQLGLDRAEVGLDLARLGLAGGRELVEDRFLERVAGAEVAQHAGDQDRDRPEQDQNRKQLCGQAPARGAGRAGIIGRTHNSNLAANTQMREVEVMVAVLHWPKRGWRA